MFPEEITDNPHPSMFATLLLVETLLMLYLDVPSVPLSTVKITLPSALIASMFISESIAA